jgi:hypothetical protein
MVESTSTSAPRFTPCRLIFKDKSCGALLELPTPGEYGINPTWLDDQLTWNFRISLTG